MGWIQPMFNINRWSLCYIDYVLKLSYIHPFPPYPFPHQSAGSNDAHNNRWTRISDVDSVLKRLAAVVMSVKYVGEKKYIGEEFFRMLVKLYVDEDRNLNVYWWNIKGQNFLFLYVGDHMNILLFHAYLPTYIFHHHLSPTWGQLKDVTNNLILW